MNELENFLSEEYGFERNSWRFLTGTIDGVEYTLMHEPIGGYVLQYTFVSTRQAGHGNIKLGRNPSIENFIAAVKKICGV